MKDWNMRMTDPMNRVWLQPGGYLEGCVITAHGVVYAYSQGGTRHGIKETPATMLQVVYGGRLYNRDIAKRYTRRGLVTVANRFASEIAAPTPTGGNVDGANG